MSDLVERLRKWPVARVNDKLSPCAEAADRIEGLEADARSDAAKALRADGELHEALACIAALEAALRSIANNTCCDGCQEAARVARAALSPAPER